MCFMLVFGVLFAYVCHHEIFSRAYGSAFMNNTTDEENLCEANVPIKNNTWLCTIFP
jgi:hypothetical protein